MALYKQMNIILQRNQWAWYTEKSTHWKLVSTTLFKDTLTKQSKVHVDFHSIL